MIGRFARRTPTTLADLAQQYLAQDLPDISGIFSLPQASTSTTTPEVAEQISNPAGLTLEQLKLLYPQYFGQQQEDGDRGLTPEELEEQIKFRQDNNAGIYSFKDLRNVFSATPMAAKIGGLLGGPFGFAAGLIGTNVADRLGFTQAGRDRKARELAAQRGADKQRIQDLRNFNENYQQYFGGDSGGDSGPSYSGMGSIGSGGVSQRDAGPGYDSVEDAGSF